MIKPLSLRDTPPEAEAYTYDELSAMTKAELLELAEELGVEGLSINNLKDDIITGILGVA
jgi:DNA-binding Xre family transcriptional regulator